jgi:phage head maturation protease
MNEPRIVHKNAFVIVREVSDDGVYDIDISTEGEDRIGDVIEVDGWHFDNYMRNPVVMWAHDYKSVPIGQALAVFKEPPALRAQFKFREPANEHDPVLPIKAAWDQGALRAASVGFDPLVWKLLDDEDMFGPVQFIEQDLLEFSLVPIPMNADALRRSVQEFLKSLALPEEPSADALMALEAATRIGDKPGSDDSEATELSEAELVALKDYLESLKKLILGE